jgi:hypothetical protein
MKHENSAIGPESGTDVTGSAGKPGFPVDIRVIHRNGDSTVSRPFCRARRAFAVAVPQQTGANRGLRHSRCLRFVNFILRNRDKTSSSLDAISCLGMSAVRSPRMASSQGKEIRQTKQWGNQVGHPPNPPGFSIP